MDEAPHYDLLLMAEPDATDNGRENVVVVAADVRQPPILGQLIDDDFPQKKAAVGHRQSQLNELEIAL